MKKYRFLYFVSALLLIPWAGMAQGIEITSGGSIAVTEIGRAHV